MYLFCLATHATSLYTHTARDLYYLCLLQFSIRFAAPTVDFMDCQFTFGVVV
jgi:hypothetical protein